MKKLLLVFILTSVSSFAKEKCTIEAYGSIFKTNGEIFKNAEITDVKSITRENTWEDCYKKANSIAQNYNSIVPVSISGRRVEGGSASTGLHVYFQWSFDDSSIPFFDTSGKITKYTTEFETYPTNGDLRYFVDGRLFE